MNQSEETDLIFKIILSTRESDSDKGKKHHRMIKKSF